MTKFINLIRLYTDRVRKLHNFDQYLAIVRPACTIIKLQLGLVDVNRGYRSVHPSIVRVSYVCSAVSRHTTLISRTMPALHLIPTTHDWQNDSELHWRRDMPAIAECSSGYVCGSTRDTSDELVPILIVRTF